ncbi:hypothetical protein PIIN_03686 [Serendipita indica DSM 11827]|uniref:Uncharacterized protein n=1 Tax=Serendipita indica (strain DSM 11827) TaxID=1109443 RepID=G4TEJ6_SERID|nr:hypothetical protein PIIN_03686 [Serendipita indica DSM 11827]
MLNTFYKICVFFGGLFVFNALTQVSFVGAHSTLGQINLSISNHTSIRSQAPSLTTHGTLLAIAPYTTFPIYSHLYFTRCPKRLSHSTWDDRVYRQPGRLGHREFFYSCYVNLNRTRHDAYLPSCYNDTRSSRWKMTLSTTSVAASVYTPTGGLVYIPMASATERAWSVPFTSKVPFPNSTPSTLNNHTGVNNHITLVHDPELQPLLFMDCSDNSSHPLPDTASIPTDRQPESNSESQGSGSGKSAPTALVILLSLLALGGISYLYKYLRRRRALAMTTAEWDDEMWAIYRRHILGETLDDSVSWIGPEIWAPEYVEMMKVQPAVTRSPSTRSRSILRWSNLSFGAIFGASPFNNEHSDHDLPEVDMPYKLSLPENAYSV